MFKIIGDLKCLNMHNYTSNFWEVDRMDTTTTSVIKQLKSHLARFGIPSMIVGDNGPQYLSEEFRKFAAKWDFEHQTSTSAPVHQNANGKAETAVKAANLMFSKCKKSQTDPYILLLEIRNTYTNTMSGKQPSITSTEQENSDITANVQQASSTTTGRVSGPRQNSPQ